MALLRDWFPRVPRMRPIPRLAPGVANAPTPERAVNRDHAPIMMGQVRQKIRHSQQPNGPAEAFRRAGDGVRADTSVTAHESA